MYIENMFEDCLLLKKLNLTRFKTNNVTDMMFMFSYCSNFKKLDLSNFNTIVTKQCICNTITIQKTWRL